MAKRKITHGQTTIYKAQKTKDRTTRTKLKTVVNTDAPEGDAVSAPLLTPVVLL